MSEPATVEGLRARKKQQTRHQLAEAAYGIVRDHGVDALTADAVAQRADVSRRTFFNYFPTVESALEPVVEDFLTDIEVKLGEVEIGADVMASVARAVRENDDESLLERITVLGVATLTSQSHRSLLHECAQSWLAGFAERLHERLGAQIDELYAVTAATALVAAAESSLRVWHRRTGGELNPRTLAERQALLADALELLGRGFDPQDGDR